MPVAAIKKVAEFELVELNWLTLLTGLQLSPQFDNMI